MKVKLSALRYKNKYKLCSNAGTRTPIAGARNQCPTVRRHSIYIVYYTLYIASIQGEGVF